MIIDILILIFAAMAFVISLAVLIKTSAKQGNKAASFEDVQGVNQNIALSKKELAQEISTSLYQNLTSTSKSQADLISQMGNAQRESLGLFQKTLNDQLTQIEKRMQNTSISNETRLDKIRETVEQRLSAMQTDNNKKLDEMRKTVDEQLQNTLEKKLQQSFERVSKQLESVYKGLGEMQSLAVGVGDLKKVLSNVKTRGILGEIQLGAILEQILTPEQYDKNVPTVPGASERVEFAVKLPGDGDTHVYLPIDAKFPQDAYMNLLDAQETADKVQIDIAVKNFTQRIKGFAKDISTKYVRVPHTTEFAIMFLPIEGLYAEVVRHGLIERLQNDYKVIIAGPTTMAALLNSLQMGFKTLAIQKSSSEVWKVLGNVQSEFDTFGKVLTQAQTRISQANDELEKLVGVRTRQIQRKLSMVENYHHGETNEHFLNEQNITNSNFDG